MKNEHPSTSPPGESAPDGAGQFHVSPPRGPKRLLGLMAGLMGLLFAAPSEVQAQQIPPGCTGSGLGISLFTSSPDVHIGDTIRYSVNVFNGSLGSTRIVCDAIDIQAGIVTPDGVTNRITLVRTALSNGQSDFYPDVVSYVVRAQDIRADGTLRATAFDDGIILQNDTPSRGGSDQGVNTEVSQPCIGISVTCLGTTGEDGLISFSGLVTNCGNNTLVGVTVTNSNENGSFRVVFTNNILRGETVAFTGSFNPLNPCTTDTVTLVATGTDQFTSNPRTVLASASATCATSLTPGIAVTKVCPVGPVSPGQQLVYTGTVRNTGNVTLTNVTVVSDSPANTVVLTLATLAPGATANYTGSYVAPVDCSTTSRVVALGASICGVPVTSSATSTCAIVTTPLIAVTTVCATDVAGPGGVQTYNGTVRNTGNIALRNVVVRSDRPAANTTVFTVATLAPGATATFSGTYTVPLTDACAVTTTVVATGQDICTDASVTSTAVLTCGVTTAPLLALTLDCPTVPSATGGQIVFTGTVRNSGNVTLNNVSVVNSQDSPSTVLTVATLAPGASASFTVSFMTPMDACEVSATVNASGTDACTTLGVTATRSVTCPLMTAPALVVTQECPPFPASPGGLFSYTGTVRNTGNVTLTNVVVSDDRNGFAGTPTTTLWADDDVPAGSTRSVEGNDTWNFVQSNPTPFSGNRAHQSNLGPGRRQHFFEGATDGLTVNAGDILIAYIYLDPANLPSQVMLQWNDGTSWEHRAYWGANLINYGQNGTDSRRFMGALPVAGQWVRLEVPARLVGLENKVLRGASYTLFDGRATWDALGKLSGAANPTEVFTVARLAPGASASFSGSYTLPTTGACSVTSTLIAAAMDNCSKVNVTATTSSTCPLLTEPAIEVSQACPPSAGVMGQLLNYTGTVKNIGNIMLTNVVVRNSRTGTSPVLVLATLSPGESANFSGSYVVPVNCCTISSTATATGGDICTGAVVADTATSTCQVLSSPQITVTKVCPLVPSIPGVLHEYTGTVMNTGDITLTDVYVVNDRTGASAPMIGPLTLAPGESAGSSGSYIYRADYCGNDSVIGTGVSICGVTVTNRATTICPAIPTLPGIEVTKNCPVVPPSFGTFYTFTGTVRNTGNVTLIDVYVVNNQPTNNAPVIGPINLAPGQTVNFTGTFLAPMDCCEITETIIATGRDLCSGNTVTDRASTACPIMTTPRLVVVENCPVGSVVVGGLFSFTGSITNTGDVNLTNVVVFSTRSGGVRVPLLGPVELAPGESARFNGSYVVASTDNPSQDVIEATGMDTCLGRTVIARANCAGPIDQSTAPMITFVGLENGVATVSWDSVAGFIYTVQCKANHEDPIWIDIPGNVTATGGSASKTDVVGPSVRRFYRVLVTQ